MAKEREYGLFTAIAMIVGIVIGSGIFLRVITSWYTQMEVY